jgi:hypothetical protein
MIRARLRFPGRYSFYEGFLRAAPHCGWFEPASGVYGESMTAHFAVRREFAAGSFFVEDPAEQLKGSDSFWLHRAAEACPVVALTSENAQYTRRAGIRVVSFSWTSASNSGAMFDTLTGREASPCLSAYSLEPLARVPATATAKALASHLGKEEVDRLAHELTRGMSAARVEALGMPALSPSLDRLIEWVSAGAMDEEGTQLSLMLWEASFADTHKQVAQDWESEVWPLMEEDDASRLAAKAVEDLHGTDAADTPWGPGFLLTLPGVRFDRGDRLPPATRWYFPDAWRKACADVDG